MGPHVTSNVFRLAILSPLEGPLSLKAVHKTNDGCRLIAMFARDFLVGDFRILWVYLYKSIVAH